MSTVANCPKCKTEIGIPEGVDLSRRARCPHCKSEFTLREAIDSAAKAGEEVSDEKKDSTAERPSWKEKLTKKWAAPVSDQGVPDPLANAERGTGTDEPWNTPEGKTQAARRERKARNPVVELVKITLGGVLGLSIGYGILLWVFKTDPFDLAKYLPAVLVPDAVKPAGAGRNGGGGNAAAAPDQNGVAAGEKKVDPFAQPKAGEQAKNDATSKRPELPPLQEPSEPPEEDGEGPKNASVYMMADLVRGMADANDAQAALDIARGAKAGSDPSASGGVVNLKAAREHYYDRLAKLAEVVTLLPKSNDRAISRSTAAAMVIQGMAERTKLEELAALAAERMNSEDDAKRGIVLAGTVKSVEPEGEEFRTVIELTNQQTEAPVISAEKPEVGVDDTAIVLGTVVKDPEHNLWHYTGHDKQVVWGGAIVIVGPRAHEPPPF